MFTTIKGLSKEQIISLDIIPALGGYEEDYDIDAIFDEAYEYSPELDGFYSTVDGDQFWDIAAANDLTME